MFEVQVHDGGAAARHVDQVRQECFPSQDGLNWKTLLSRRAAPRIILGLGLVDLPASAHDKYKIPHNTVVSPSPPKRRASFSSSLPVDNDPTHPELSFRSFLRQDGRSTRKPLTSIPWDTGDRSARTPLAAPMCSAS